MPTGIDTITVTDNGLEIAVIRVQDGVSSSSSGSGGGSLTAQTLTVAQLKALTSMQVDDKKWVYDATYGLGAYIFSADATATSAPTYYRADDDSGVWSKIL